MPGKPSSKPKSATKSKPVARAKPAPKTKPAATAKPLVSAPAVLTSGQEVVLLGGFPAAGKSTLARELLTRGYERLNRDDEGGSLDDLLPKLDKHLSAGKSVLLDNLYATAASRAGALQVARKHGVPVRFLHLTTSMDDAQFNACLRMIDKCGKVLHPEDHKLPQWKGDPGLYPVAVFYKYRKDFEEPTVKEGFAAVEEFAFTRTYPKTWKNKAAIFDFDGTLRDSLGKEKYPCTPAEVKGMVERGARLKALQKEGYLLLGASNQSGVAKGKLTAADAKACFDETARQLGVKFTEVLFCPHRIPPISCYCRKPNPAMGVELITRYNLDPRQSLYIGDLGTDRSFAVKCGFQFRDQTTFFV